jgi:phosphoribosyl-AMP cyclohydrolase / phosphoribosyl-ATP pyrophosphohydrolase
VLLRFGEAGLLPVVAQDRLTGQVRMVAYADRDAIARTLATGRATFFSRSRGALWEKGASSGHSLHVVSVVADCDADAILYMVDPVGPTCHTGSPSCFFRRVGADGSAEENGRDAAAFLEELEREIEGRKASTAAKSYTKHLLDGGPARIGEKLREEAAELAEAIASETDERVASEAADVIYHLLVGLSSRGVPLRSVIAALAARSGTSGHDEKAQRAEG